MKYRFNPGSVVVDKRRRAVLEVLERTTVTVRGRAVAGYLVKSIGRRTRNARVPQSSLMRYPGCTCWYQPTAFTRCGASQ